MLELTMVAPPSQSGDEIMMATATKEVGYVKSFAYMQEVSNSDGGVLFEKLDKILEEPSWLRAEVKMIRMMQD